MSLRRASLAVLLSSLLAAPLAPPAHAQSAEDVAKGSLMTLTAIMATAVTCGYKLDAGFVDVISANSEGLAKKAKLSDAQGDATFKAMTAELAKDKKTNCAMKQPSFPSYAALEFNRAIEQAKGTGVALKPLPQSAAAEVGMIYMAQKSDANDWLNLAALVEAVSDECDAKLADGDSLNIDRAQYFWRGKADWTAEQFKEVLAHWETEVKANKAKYCAPSFGFKKQLDQVLASIK